MKRSALNPKNAPTNVNGTEINNHKLNNATRVPNGTAAEEPLPQSIRLEMKKTEKRMPGTKKLVNKILLFHARPSMVL